MNNYERLSITPSEHTNLQHLVISLRCWRNARIQSKAYIAIHLSTGKVYKSWSAWEKYSENLFQSNDFINLTEIITGCSVIESELSPYKEMVDIKIVIFYLFFNKVNVTVKWAVSIRGSLGICWTNC